MKTVFILAVVLLLSCVHAEEVTRFYDHKVIRAHIVDNAQATLVEKMGLDVWSHDSVVIVGALNDIMVNATHLAILEGLGVEYEVMIPDVEQHIENERESLRLLANKPQASWYESYHTLSEIYTHYQDLAGADNNLPVAWNASIGKTFEGRDIAAIKFGNPKGKKRIYFEGGQHAREWIGHATTAYLTEQLITLSKTDAAVKKLTDNIEFVVVPVVNPDGYLYTWGANRLWRKNRRVNTGGSYGVDLNRNWNDHWGGSGSSSTPSSDTYHGTAPFSEPETRAVSQFYQDNGPYDGAIDYHSYSQLVLRPYGWTKELPPNDKDATEVGDGIRDAIKAVHNVQYTSEASWELYYTAGTAQDWFYSEGKSPLAYTIELRDAGKAGFQLPPDQIIPTGEENWAAFKYFANWILDH